MLRALPNSKQGWSAVAVWSIAAAILTFAIIAMMSIGIFVLPFALIAIFLVARANRWWPEGPAGALIGAAAVALYVGLMSLVHRVALCPADGRSNNEDYGSRILRPQDQNQPMIGD